LAREPVRRRWLVFPALVAGAGAVLLLFSTAGHASEPAVTPVSTEWNEMAVDAYAGTDPVDASVTLPVGAPFEASVNITQAGSPFDGYWAKLQFESDVLAYRDPPGVTYMGLGRMTLDRTPDVGADYVLAGSALISGNTTATGQAHRIGFECIGEGTSSLHLVTFAEDPSWGSTTLGPSGGAIIPTGLTDASVVCASGSEDADRDGCSFAEEVFVAAAPAPGATCPNPDACYSDSNWYDFYDVPVPAYPDPTPNGSRDQAVAMCDVLAVLFYVGAYDGDGGDPNANGVAYDSMKGSCDIDGDTVAEKEGLCYDRSPGGEPNPPWEVGPPDGAVTMSDVLAVLAQFGLDCREPP